MPADLAPPANPEAPPAVSAQPLLEARDLSVRYGGVLANDNITLSVAAGEVVGLIGPNGAGKTTFVDAVTGFTKARGEVSLAGERIDRAAPHRRRKAGLARTWQAGELFTDLTVAQNLAVAVQGTGVWTMFRDIFTGTPPPTEQITQALDL